MEMVQLKARFDKFGWWLIITADRKARLRKQPGERGGGVAIPLRPMVAMFERSVGSRDQFTRRDIEQMIQVTREVVDRWRYDFDLAPDVDHKTAGRKRTWGQRNTFAFTLAGTLRRFNISIEVIRNVIDEVLGRPAATKTEVAETKLDKINA